MNINLVDQITSQLKKYLNENVFMYVNTSQISSFFELGKLIRIELRKLDDDNYRTINVVTEKQNVVIFVDKDFEVNTDMELSFVFIDYGTGKNIAFANKKQFENFLQEREGMSFINSNVIVID